MASLRDVSQQADIYKILTDDLGLHEGPEKSPKWKCPLHEDSSASLSLDVPKKRWKCFGCNQAGDSLDWIKIFRKLPHSEAVRELIKYGASKKDVEEVLSGKRKDKEPVPWDWRNPEAIYKYTDESGKVLYEKYKYSYLMETGKKKNVYFTKAPGERKFKGIPKGTKKVLYNLPGVINAVKKGEKVYIVEGEKDADNIIALGLTATTNCEGSATQRTGDNNWCEEYNLPLEGADVVICCDNDAPGERHGKRLRAELNGRANSIKILWFNDQGLKKKQDVSDWLSNGRTREDLEELVAKTEVEAKLPPEVYEPDPYLVLPDTPDEKPFLEEDEGSELWFARLAAKWHGEDLRYVDSWRQWMAWRGDRWRKDYGEARRRMVDTSDQIFELAVDELRKAEGQSALDKAQEALKKILNFRKQRPLMHAMSLTEALPTIEVGLEVWDQDPMLLNMRNCTLDLEKVKPREHSRNDYMIKMGGTNYEEGASSPLWDAYLERVIKDPEERRYLQTLAGYFLTGLTEEQVFPFAYGPGGNGKTVFAEVLVSIMGQYAGILPHDMLIHQGNKERHPTEIADLHGVRLAIGAETPEKSRWNEAMLKKLTGSDKLKARRMREDFWEFKPTHKLFVIGNEKPRVMSTNQGVWRRMQLIPFPEIIPKEERNKKLVQQICEKEKPGVLNWALEGLRIWHKEGGLKIPKIIESATMAYRKAEDIIGQFIEETLTQERGPELTTREMHSIYATWCEEMGIKPMGQRTLTGVLQNRLTYKTSPRRRFVNVRCRLPNERNSEEEPQENYGHDKDLIEEEQII